MVSGLGEEVPYFFEKTISHFSNFSPLVYSGSVRQSQREGLLFSHEIEIIKMDDIIIIFFIVVLKNGFC